MHIDNDKNLSKSSKANGPNNFNRGALKHLCDPQYHTCLNTTFVMPLVNLQHEEMHHAICNLYIRDTKGNWGLCDVTIG